MRLQLALNVRDIDEAVDYYSRAFRQSAAQAQAGLCELCHRPTAP